MKHIFLSFLTVVVPLLAMAQFSVVSVQPANLSKNVPLNTTISMTFSEELDTNTFKEDAAETFYSNITNSNTTTIYSNGNKTISTTVVLEPNTSYFVAFIYVKAKSGATITTPHVFYFTTGADFAPYSVSGTVLPGSTGIAAEGGIVGLARENIMKQKEDGPPLFSGWTNIGSNGTFSVPYMTNGTYWPVAVKDVNHDGNINPETGVDAIAIGDSIIVSNGSFTGLNLTFLSLAPKTFHGVIATAESLANGLPADRVLRRISAWDIDTLGRSTSWEFMYSVNGNSIGRSISIHPMNNDIYTLDQGFFDYVKTLKPIANPSGAVSSAVVIANVENAGGKEVRYKKVADSLKFRTELTMSDQKNGWFNPTGYDTSKVYWSVSYAWTYEKTPGQQEWVDGKIFLCDLSTGAVLKTQNLLGVIAEPAVPSDFSLYQNYPNPFNPVTTISFTLPSAAFTTLTVFDLLGRTVTELVSERMDAGPHSVTFNGNISPSGVYFYQLRSGMHLETKKMVLVR